jgi:hypothetical protein
MAIKLKSFRSGLLWTVFSPLALLMAYVIGREVGCRVTA